LTLEGGLKTALEAATLAGGCFWCLEAVFKDVKGVTGVMPGYAGGKTENPSYEEVCRGTSGHAESIQITFDPEQTSYRELLEIFFTVHDPTTLNRQGHDIGTQYRSAIFYHNEAQKAIAEGLVGEMAAARVWKSKIVTEIVPFTRFFPAEKYHVDYFASHPEQAYCQVVIAPKVEKFRKTWAKKRAGVS
jgi:peptide-methionine (S)-S-oxide reductase